MKNVPLRRSVILAMILLVHTASSLAASDDNALGPAANIVQLGGVARVALPPGFEVTPITSNLEPAVFLVIGPSPNQRGDERPCIFINISPPDWAADRDAYGLDAVVRAKLLTRRMGLAITAQEMKPSKTETYRIDLKAENQVGTPIWFSIRTYVKPGYAMQATAYSFDVTDVPSLLKALDEQEPIAD